MDADCCEASPKEYSARPLYKPRAHPYLGVGNRRLGLEKQGLREGLAIRRPRWKVASATPRKSSRQVYAPLGHRTSPVAMGFQDLSVGFT